MMKTRLATVLALALGLALPMLAVAPASAITTPPLKRPGWSFDGPFGTYDQAALQRGYQVYKEVCAACHSLNYLAYRDLANPGGPGFTPAQVKVLAAENKVPAGPDKTGATTDDNGDPLMRPALPSDRFVDPFPNPEAAAAANNGAVPPDLSLIVNARAGGADYVYSYLSGFDEGKNRPACLGSTPGKYYNLYFPNGSLPDSCKDKNGKPLIDGSLVNMPPQLPPDRVSFADGKDATTDQMAHDVTEFLEWAANPHLEQRKSTGFQVMLYLVILSIFLYISYRRVWRNIEH
jgi:ubiquinol-cytochrome c reductase cytochrome c1 subunit